VPDKMSAYHRKGLELQLEQFTKGAALAVALGRTLILPRLVCYCDKHWTGLEHCRMPGAQLVSMPAHVCAHCCVTSGAEPGCKQQCMAKPGQRGVAGVRHRGVSVSRARQRRIAVARAGNAMKVLCVLGLQQMLPFLCPLDHVMDASHFSDAAAELLLPFRESTFLSNPRGQLPEGRKRKVRDEGATGSLSLCVCGGGGRCMGCLCRHHHCSHTEAEAGGRTQQQGGGCRC
jgi:hypothetical protein